jgi:hypothetical protein
MVRVAGLAGQVREGITLKSPDGRTPEQQLEQLLLEVERLQEDQQKSLSALMLLLNKEGIESITRDGLTKDEKIWLEDHFQEQVFPVLTPLSIDPAHPFPFPTSVFRWRFGCAIVRLARKMKARSLRPPGGTEALHPFADRKTMSASFRSKRRSASTSASSSPATRSRAPARSASSATVISRSRRSPRIWCACSRLR